MNRPGDAETLSLPPESHAQRRTDESWGEGPEAATPVDSDPEPRTVHATVTGWAVADRRPIVPAWARNRTEAGQLARWVARYGAHASLYHGSRAPKYAGKLLAYSPRGAWLAVAGAGRWVFDAEAAPLRLSAVARQDAGEYMRLTKERNGRVKRRGIVAGVLTGAGVAAAVLASLWAPTWAWWLAVVALVVTLGVVGTPRDRRVTDPVVTTPAAPPRLTADVVTRALQALGISAMGPKTGPISYPAPITRDGPGWRADVDLPHGVTVTDVMERRDRLASGLRRPLSAVWPEPSLDQHAGRLVLWVGDQPLNKVRPAAWPLARTGGVDLLGGTLPFGTDQRQRPVTISLAETNALIGSLPGGGKTAAVRVLALAAALDPHAELRVSEHKGSGDLDALEKVAHRYTSGVSDDHIADTLASLREVHAELDRRAQVLAKLPRQVVPDRKVTSELAHRRGSGLHPLVMIVDEAQEVFSHGDHGKEAGELAERIIKRGRALGVILLLATQRPDSKSLPTGVSTNVGVRFCLRVMDQTANDMVLGTSAYKTGIRATTFSPRDKGIGYLVGVGDEPIVCRTFYVDADTAEKVSLRARAAREAAGLLSGYAAGDDTPLTPAASLLDDLRVVFATATDDRLWSETVLRRLAEHRPELYAGWTPEALTAACKPLGIRSRQVWGTDDDGTGRNRRGLSRDDVMAAIETRPGDRAEITS